MLLFYRSSNPMQEVRNTSLPFTAWGVLGGVRCQKEQIPPDLVVKFQAVDIVEVI